MKLKGKRGNTRACGWQLLNDPSASKAYQEWSCFLGCAEQALLIDLASKKPLHPYRCGIIPFLPLGSIWSSGQHKVVFFNWGINRQNEKGWVAGHTEKTAKITTACKAWLCESWRGVCNSSASGIVPDQALRDSNKKNYTRGQRNLFIHNFSTPLADGKNWTVTERKPVVEGSSIWFKNK